MPLCSYNIFNPPTHCFTHFLVGAKATEGELREKPTKEELELVHTFETEANKEKWVTFNFSSGAPFLGFFKYIFPNIF